MPAGLTSTGIEVPRLEELLDAFDAAYLADTGIDIDSKNPDNAKKLMARLAGYHADQIVKLSDVLQTLYDSFDPEAARGVQATYYGRINGIERKTETKSTVTITCSGTDSTVITVGSRVQGGTSDPDAQWVATTGGTISGGSVDIVFEAQNAGAKTAFPDSIQRIVTPISGWDACNNAGYASVGLDDETDGELLRRRKNALGARAGAGVIGVRSRLLQLSFVQDIAILANGDSEQKDIAGVTMPANSYLLVVLPSTLTTPQEKEVLDVLFDSVYGTAKAAGSDVDGEITLLTDGSSWPVAFNYGADLAVTLAFTITMRDGASETDARTALDDAVQNLLPMTLGEPLFQLELCQLAWETGLIATASVIIQGVDDDFQPAFDERIATFTVTVNGVTP